MRSEAVEFVLLGYLSGVSGTLKYQLSTDNFTLLCHSCLTCCFSASGSFELYLFIYILILSENK